ncbi:MAG: hypothetical protein IH886_08340 [Nitrospinae bacterium]|nr:hypothetical protein [Nitrospinota bacterium]
MRNKSKTKAGDRNRKQRRTREALERRGFTVLQFLDGEYSPVLVAATHIDKVWKGSNQKTLSNWRSLGIGPKYCLIGGKVFYEIEVLREFAKKFEVQTTGHLERTKQAEVA